MIEAVVFDLDGVLVDSEPVWEQVRRQVVAGHGGHWAADTQQRLMGMSTPEWARYLTVNAPAGTFTRHNEDHHGGVAPTPCCVS